MSAQPVAQDVSVFDPQGVLRRFMEDQSFGIGPQEVAIWNRFIHETKPRWEQLFLQPRLQDALPYQALAIFYGMVPHKWNPFLDDGYDLYGPSTPYRDFPAKGLPLVFKNLIFKLAVLRARLTIQDPEIDVFFSRYQLRADTQLLQRLLPLAPDSTTKDQIAHTLLEFDLNAGKWNNKETKPEQLEWLLKAALPERLKFQLADKMVAHLRTHERSLDQYLELIGPILDREFVTTAFVARTARFALNMATREPDLDFFRWYHKVCVRLGAGRYRSLRRRMMIQALKNPDLPYAHTESEVSFLRGFLKDQSDLPQLQAEKIARAIARYEESKLQIEANQRARAARIAELERQMRA
jgi:hypothetical protein